MTLERGYGIIIIIMRKGVRAVVKAVIFDMDGLIFDSEKLLVRFWCQAANELGFPMEREHALNLRSLARKFAEPYLQGLFGSGFDYATVRARRMELMAQYLEQHPLELKRGLTQLLDYLDGAGIPAAIATATDITRASEYLERAGVLERFGRIVCASMVESGKPKPDIYLYAAAQLGLAPQECAALEDSPNGVRSASSAGCVTIMIPDLTQPDDELKALICAKADSLADVPEILESMK